MGGWGEIYLTKEKIMKALIDVVATAEQLALFSRVPELTMQLGYTILYVPDVPATPMG